LRAKNSRYRKAVCVVDTGIATDVIPREVILDGINLSGDGASDCLADAQSRHGSAMAATILREAPSAQLVVVKLLDGNGWLRDDERLDAALEWIGRHREALGIGVICAALAKRSHHRRDEPFRDTALRRTIAELRASGVPMVVPAGNWQAHLGGAQPQGMAWPAILREVVSVGALDGPVGSRGLHRYSQRLHATFGTGCQTTLFAVPGPPGETSGAAAVVAGRLAALRLVWPDDSVDDLVQRLLAGGHAVQDETGLAWPSLADA